MVSLSREGPGNASFPGRCLPPGCSLYNSLSSTVTDYLLFGICVTFHNIKGLNTSINLTEINYTYKRQPRRPWV